MGHQRRRAVQRTSQATRRNCRLDDGRTGKSLRVLVACEFSGVVRDSFIRRGHSAVSVDLLPCESSFGPHIQGDVLDVLDRGWDIMIAHPPCTHLAASGARWWKDKLDEQHRAIDFVKALWDAPIKRVCIENPIGKLSTAFRKPDQIIQPYQFGHPEPKATCLWLRGLPILVSTNIVTPGKYQVLKSGKRIPEWYSNAPKAERWKIRSRTFQGIADAMADQWTMPA